MRYRRSSTPTIAPPETAPAVLISPYGGRLVDLLPADAAQRDELRDEARTLPSLQVPPRVVCDIEMLATGGFSPLDRFLGAASYRRVLREMRLGDGTLFPMPITLPLAADAGVREGSSIALRSPANELLGVLDVEEIFAADPEEAALVTGTSDSTHPLVAEMGTWGPRRASGRLRVLALPRYHDAVDLRWTPAQTRARLAAMGDDRVVAFQTRNPIHRAHEWLTKRAADDIGGVLLLHPVVGMTKPGDIDHYTRIRCYRTLVARHYDRRTTVLALLPLAMRMAGPREALWHAIIRRNYGASHFIVGRDHASPGLDARGRPFYGPADAQALFARHEAEIGVRQVRFDEVVFLPDEGTYTTRDQVSDDQRVWTMSGTAVRDRYLAEGRRPPAWFTRPEIADLLLEARPPRRRQGFCVWLTGLSGAGKSTIAEILAVRLLEAGRQATVLDGDVVRTLLSKGLGFSKEDRDANVMRLGYVASEIVRHHGVAIVAAVSPYEAARSRARGLVGEDRFVLVHVDAPIEVCASRDTKGLYEQARRGLLKGFTGIDDPYEAPAAADVRFDTSMIEPEDSVAAIFGELVRRGFVKALHEPAARRAGRRARSSSAGAGVARREEQTVAPR